MKKCVLSILIMFFAGCSAFVDPRIKREISFVNTAVQSATVSATQPADYEKALKLIAPHVTVVDDWMNNRAPASQPAK